MTGNDKKEAGTLGQASDWFLRLREPSSTEDDARAFERWLALSDENARAWAKICRAWEAMGELPAERPLPPAVVSLAAARRPRRAGRLVAAVTALAAAVLLTFALPLLIAAHRADFTTGTGERRIVSLEDGSTVELAGASGIDADFRDGARHVRLLYGEAYFDVAHDPNRPFTVDAGAVKVAVLGTAFDVRLSPASVTVELVRGGVDMSVTGSGEHARLTPGEAATFSGETGRIAHAFVPPADMAVWRSGRLFVSDVPVSAVIETLRRYHPAWISIADGELAERRVTGLYDLTDPDRALAALVEPFGGRVRHFSPYLRVVGR